MVNAITQIHTISKHRTRAKPLLLWIQVRFKIYFESGVERIGRRIGLGIWKNEEGEKWHEDFLPWATEQWSYFLR